MLSLLGSQAVPTQTRGTQKVPWASSRISHPVIDKSSSRWEQHKAVEPAHENKMRWKTGWLNKMAFNPDLLARSLPCFQSLFVVLEKSFLGCAYTVLSAYHQTSPKNSSAAGLVLRLLVLWKVCSSLGAGVLSILERSGWRLLWKDLENLPSYS